MTLIIQKPTGAKLNLRKDYVEVDPYFSNVSLLLHGDGTNGSTTIVDSSPTPKTMTAVGNAQVSTTQKKFGTGALYFDGTGDYLTTVNSSDHEFGAGSFTIEMWLYFPSFVGAASVVTKGWSGGTVRPWLIYQDGSLNRLSFYASSNNSSWDIASQLPIINSPSLNTWYHIAVVRNGSTIYTFSNGSRTASVGSSASMSSTTTPLTVGASSTGGNAFTGYIDDLRITKGVARYTANFTPPTAAFADAQF